MGGMADGGGPGRLSVPSLRMYDVVIRVIRASLPVRGHRFCSNQGLPALHRSTAVYRFAIPLLHGRDGRQRRSWAAFFVQSLRMYDVFIRVIRALSSCSRAPFLQ